MSIDFPTLEDVLGEVLETFRQSLFTALPGRVESYDASKQTASVSIQVMDTHPPRAFPVLPSVPVSFPRAGNLAITIPVASGDTGLLVFTSMSMDVWRATGAVAAPTDSQRMTPMSAVFFPGLWPATRSLPATDGSSIVLGQSGSADFVALAQKVDDALDKLRNATTTAIAAMGGPGLAFAGAAAVTAAFMGGYSPAPPTGPVPPQPSVGADDVKAS